MSGSSVVASIELGSAVGKREANGVKGTLPDIHDEEKEGDAVK
jgi:hypothetical protein